MTNNSGVVKSTGVAFAQPGFTEMLEPLVRREPTSIHSVKTPNPKKTKHKKTGTKHSRIATQGNTQVLLSVPSPPVLNRTQPYSTVLDRTQRHFGLVCPSLAK